MTTISRSRLAEIVRPRRMTVIVKASVEQRYVLGVVYPAGPRDHLLTGVDGHRDFVGAQALEQAAWSYIRKGAPTGIAHATYFGLPRADEAQVVESYLWPAGAPDWHTTDINGRDAVVKAGDWLVGAILTPKAFAAVKAREYDGWSMQGTVRRRTNRRNP